MAYNSLKQTDADVLIVPCGIEINLRLSTLHVANVLIVPCGIEIRLDELAQVVGGVLIVPCGIEICLPHGVCTQCVCLNRTMWN